MHHVPDFDAYKREARDEWKAHPSLDNLHWFWSFWHKAYYLDVLKPGHTGFCQDPEHFGVVMMLKSDVQKLFPAPRVHYYSYKGKVDNIEDFKGFINSNWGLLKFVERDQNPRIIYTEMKVENAKRITLPISLFIIIVSSSIPKIHVGSTSSLFLLHFTLFYL